MKPGTLRTLLYADAAKALVSEREWVQLLRAVSGGDQLALHALYERSHRLVFTVIMRITKDRASAEELTLDVFHDVWRRASRYEVASGTVLGWIMNQARSRAIDRLRFDRRKKRVNPHLEEPQSETAAVGFDERADSERDHALRNALTILTPDERSVIETAFFSELTYAEVALRLNQPVGTVKTRIRSGLSKLRQVLMTELPP